MKKVVIFGVFDGIHDGHMEFIKEARGHGDQLIAIIARDTVVQSLKGKLPVYNEIDRIKALLAVPEIDLVLLGDIEEGVYKTLKEVGPDIVCLGYDQQALFDSIKTAIGNSIPKMELIFSKPYKPEEYHSSIINK